MVGLTAMKILHSANVSVVISLVFLQELFFFLTAFSTTFLNT